MLPATSSATSLLPTSQQQKTLPDLPPVGATAPQPSASLHHHTAREAAQLLPASAPIPAPEHWSVRNGVAGSADGSTGLSASDLYALGYSQAPLALPAALPGLPAAGQPTSSAAMAAMAAYAAWGWAAHARAPPGLLPPAYSLPASYSQLQHGASPYEHLALSTGLSSLDEGGASSGMGAAAVRASSSLPPAPTISRNLWLGNVSPFKCLPAVLHLCASTCMHARGAAVEECCRVNHLNTLDPPNPRSWWPTRTW